MGMRSGCPIWASPWRMAAKNSRRKTRRRSSRYDLSVPQRNTGQILPNGGDADHDPAGAKGYGTGKVFVRDVHELSRLPGARAARRFSRGIVPAVAGAAHAVLRGRAGP